MTSTGGLNAYSTDGERVRSHAVIGTKGWTTWKSLSGYGRADNLDSLVGVTAAGDLVGVTSAVPAAWVAAGSAFSAEADSD